MEQYYRFIVFIAVTTLLGVIAYFLLKKPPDLAPVLVPEKGYPNDVPELKKSADSTQKQLLPLPSEIKVTNTSIKFTSGVAKALIIPNFDRALECERATGAIALEVQLSRTNDGINASVWTRRARMALRVNGFDSVGRIEYKPSGLSGIKPSVASPLDAQAMKLVITAAPRSNNANQVQDSTSLFVFKGNRRKEIPFENYKVGDGIYTLDFPMAIFAKYSPSKFESLLFIDLEKLEIAGDVPIPQDVTTKGVFFVLDSKSNALIAVEQDLSWLIAIDLAFQQKKSPESNSKEP